MADEDTVIGIDIGALTLEELEVLGDALDVDPTSIGDQWQPNGWKETMRLCRVMAWIMKRREEPEFTLEDAGRLTMPAIEALLPTEAGAEPKSGTSAISRSSRTSSGSRRLTSGR